MRGPVLRVAQATITFAVTSPELAYPGRRVARVSGGWLTGPGSELKDQALVALHRSPAPAAADHGPGCDLGQGITVRGSLEQSGGPAGAEHQGPPAQRPSQCLVFITAQPASQKNRALPEGLKTPGHHQRSLVHMPIRIASQAIALNDGSFKVPGEAGSYLLCWRVFQTAFRMTPAC